MQQLLQQQLKLHALQSCQEKESVDAGFENWIYVNGVLPSSITNSLPYTTRTPFLCDRNLNILNTTIQLHRRMSPSSRYDLCPLCAYIIHIYRLQSLVLYYIHVDPSTDNRVKKNPLRSTCLAHGCCSIRVLLYLHAGSAPRHDGPRQRNAFIGYDIEEKLTDSFRQNLVSLPYRIISWPYCNCERALKTVTATESRPASSGVNGAERRGTPFRLAYSQQEHRSGCFAGRLRKAVSSTDIFTL
jgi:hypothetical protein